MNPFLTVEDVNTVKFSNQGFWWHEIDTAVIGNKDFTNVKIDFCTVSRSTNGSNHTYTFVIDNEYWTKGYVIFRPDGQVITSTDATLSDNTLTIDLVFTSIRLFLYMGVTAYNSLTKVRYTLKEPILNLKYNELGVNRTVIVYHDFITNELVSDSFECDVGLTEVFYHSRSCGFLCVNLVKSDFQFNCTQTLTVGKVNKVYLGTDSKYKPSGSMVGSYTPNINVLYGDELLPVSFDGTDYYFNLDLTRMTETHRVPFYVIVDTNEVLNQSVTKVVLNSQYTTVNTFDRLLSAVQNSNVIRLGSNILATSDIPIKRSVKIIGNDKTLNLEGHGFILDEDIEFKIENLSIQNGETSILQRPNTKVELTNVSFTGCLSTNYDGLGSCIYCDNTYESLSEDEDFITILNDCTFTNNSSCILHGGQLTINNCRFHNTNVDFFDKHTVAFIYQTDGNCTISNSIFDIDITDTYEDTLCSEETNIGYYQCIFMCGETATINNLAYNELTSNNLDTFFNNPYNNRTHIYVKYYYPQIETCVYTTPILNYEDKAFCYGLSGDDTIHKINCQVTRSSSGNENTTRKISW